MPYDEPVVRRPGLTLLGEAHEHASSMTTLDALLDSESFDAVCLEIDLGRPIGAAPTAMGRAHQHAQSEGLVCYAIDDVPAEIRRLLNAPEEHPLRSKYTLPAEEVLDDEGRIDRRWAAAKRELLEAEFPGLADLHFATRERQMARYLAWAEQEYGHVLGIVGFEHLWAVADLLDSVEPETIPSRRQFR
jgi:pheromone shutdown protein TraB